MTVPRRHILDWTRPLPAQAAAWLARNWEGSGPLDLSDHIVIVPTRQSGRRLREALAVHAASRHQAVFPPRVWLSERLVAESPDQDPASRHDALFAWIDVLSTIDLADFGDVFPVAPPARSFSWAMRLARQFLQLQATLAESGLRIGDVPRRSDGAIPEMNRWIQLAALEGRYDAVLNRIGLRDPQSARIKNANTGSPPENASRIVLVATPDPMPLALRYLENIDARTAVEVLIVASPDEPLEDGFDPWGRPLTESWIRRTVDLPDFEQRVHLCADPSDEANRVIEALEEVPAADASIAIGIADPEVAAPLKHGLERAGRAVFDPEGRARRADPLHHLLELLGTFARNPTFTHVEALARCPDVLRWLETELPPGDGKAFSAARWLAGLDELHARHLPGTIDEARDHARSLSHHFPELGPGLERLEELRGLVTTTTVEDAARQPLHRIFGRRNLDLESEADARTVESAQAWTQVSKAVSDTSLRFGGISRQDAWEAALQAYGETVRFDDKPAEAIEFQGWLELLWEDTPHLVVCGLNDGSVPTAIVGDPFLPESLRERLGLSTNALRQARDAYLLHALIAMRQIDGQCDLLLAKFSATGEPLRPSRLLLACADQDLPGRVRYLFREIPATGANTPWRRAWKLRPEWPLRTIPSMPVTGFRNYLACPFRFYLRHGLHLESVDPQKAELDARDFGNICHAALEAMGRNPSLGGCEDGGILRDFLLSNLEERVRSIYGKNLSLPLVIQLESARQRLARAADVQAQLHAEGWRIEEVECPLKFAIGSLEVRAKIDRIDRHAETNAYRILDYKTSDRPVNPSAAHVRRTGRSVDVDLLPDFARFTIDGTDLVWIDLQLPLYLHAIGGRLGNNVSCGYFNLPKAVNDTAVALWDGYTEEWQANADRCARGVAEAVASGRFWPPAELDERRDDFASLFHHGAVESVEIGEATAKP